MDHPPSPRDIPVISDPVLEVTALPVIQPGCWRINYASSGLTYDGTIRIEAHSDDRYRTASGDLYLHRPNDNAPSPVNDIPIFPRSAYRWYLNVTEIVEISSQNSFTFGFEMWRFQEGRGTWTNDGSFTAEMKKTQAPPGYSEQQDCFAGEVVTANGTTIMGHLDMIWVSQHFRKITIEIDTVGPLGPMKSAESGKTWQEIFNHVGFAVDVVPNDSTKPVREPHSRGWSEGELHAAMLESRKQRDDLLDSSWHFHVLVVKEFWTNLENVLGIMYDWQGTDSNNVPREGVAIAANVKFPEGDKWGEFEGQVLHKATEAYFRTAVHEIGHALGLMHNNTGTFIMRQTSGIASIATPETTVPELVKWEFSNADVRALRHYNDLFVRPGGLQFAQASTSNPRLGRADSIDIPGLKLSVVSSKPEVPLGAPVRVEITLTNNSDSAIRVPRVIGLSSGTTSGTVTDPSGTVRTFKPLIVCHDACEEDYCSKLAAGDSRAASLVLMRGRQGWLFPISGVSEITVTLNWGTKNGPAVVTGTTTVFITGAYEPGHASAAHKIMTTPDAHLVLVVGGDHLTDGMEAIKKALEDPTLGPHYAGIEAKRLATPFMEREAHAGAAMNLVKKKCGVLCSAEEEKLYDLYEKATKSPSPERDL